MMPRASVPREGGVKIVFDVLEADAFAIALEVTRAGFEVTRYYDPDEEHRRGGSEQGYLRLSAQRAMTDFTEAEQRGIVADFDAAKARAGFVCKRVGTDIWTAGGDGPSGDREPRASLPKAGAGSAFAG